MDERDVRTAVDVTDWKIRVKGLPGEYFYELFADELRDMVTRSRISEMNTWS